MDPATARFLPDGKRLHLHHGPIDLIISAESRASGESRAALRAAAARFDGLLEELVAELALLRSEVGRISQIPQGPIARRMVSAVGPHAGNCFVTPMAAVAGAVADEILAHMKKAADLDRAIVNNGGDIAFHLAPGRSCAAEIANPSGTRFGTVIVTQDIPIRGIATSGRQGRSLSLGIADSVTALAATAAAADSAATLIANSVDLADHPAVQRRPAAELAPDSDLGARLAVTGCGELAAADKISALNKGAAAAEKMRQNGLIVAAGLFLQGTARIVGDVGGARQIERSLTLA